jgi:hypothetical protein
MHVEERYPFSVFILFVEISLFYRENPQSFPDDCVESNTFCNPPQMITLWRQWPSVTLFYDQDDYCRI